MTQTECRETVKLLELKAELARLVYLRERREAKVQRKLWAETVDAVVVGVRDGDAQYADSERVVPVALGDVRRDVWVQRNA